MARALFLTGAEACQPYEWYPWQMTTLEELLLRYENFACIVGPLTCATAVIGAILLFVQLACCPLLLLGHWGVHEALVVLFATDEELDRIIMSEALAPVASGSNTTKRLGDGDDGIVNAADVALSAERPKAFEAPRQPLVLLPAMQRPQVSTSAPQSEWGSTRISRDESGDSEAAYQQPGMDPVRLGERRRRPWDGDGTPATLGR